MLGNHRNRHEDQDGAETHLGEAAVVGACTNMPGERHGAEQRAASAMKTL